MNYKIEKGITAPENSRGKKYPMGDLKVGESFQFEIENYASVTNACGYFKRRYGKKFTVRKLEEDGKIVGRVWRIE